MTRETGFYWVKYKGEWIIGFFNHFNKEENQFWWSLPQEWESDLSDRHFDEIDEHQIKRSK